VGDVVEEHIRILGPLRRGGVWNYDADAIRKPSCDVP